MTHDDISNPRNELALLEACTRRIIPIDQKVDDSHHRMRFRFQVLGAIALAETTKRVSGLAENTNGRITLREAVGLSEGFADAEGDQGAFVQAAIGRFRAFQQLLDEEQVELCVAETGSDSCEAAVRLSRNALGYVSGLPRKERVPDSLRANVLKAIEAEEGSAQPDEGAEFDRVINLPEWRGNV